MTSTERDVMDEKWDTAIGSGYYDIHRVGTIIPGLSVYPVWISNVSQVRW